MPVEWFADKLYTILHCGQDLAGYTGDGSVDFRGFPILKHNTGNWRACSLILGKNSVRAFR